LLLDSLSFGLGNGDSVALTTSLGTPVDSYAFAAHVSSASRCGTSGLVFWPTTGANGSGAPSPGIENRTRQLAHATTANRCPDGQDSIINGVTESKNAPNNCP